jgi:hypothetical protein
MKNILGVSRRDCDIYSQAAKAPVLIIKNAIPLGRAIRSNIFSLREKMISASVPHDSPLQGAIP